MRLHLDFETFGTVDLPVEGVDRYTADPEFEVTLTALSVDDGPVMQWEGIPVGLLRLFSRIPDMTWHAFNAGFEMRCLERYGIHVPVSRWRCTMAHAYSRGFCKGLKDVGAQIGIKNQKLDSGMRLINLWSKPRKPTKNNPSDRLWPDARPDSWAEFKRYNVVDVLAEREIWQYLDRWPWSTEDQQVWELDQRVNRRGVPVDVEMAEKAIELIEHYKKAYDDELRELTGGISGGQTAKLLAWVNSEGLTLPNLQAKTIEEVLK